MTKCAAAAAFAAALTIAAGSADAADPARWRPGPGTTFSIVLSRAPNVTSAQVMDADLFDTTGAQVAALKRQGKRVICYMSAGSWEDWRPDKNRFPARVLGNDYDGWEGEKWLDIRQISLLAPVMRARLEQCKRKGFDAVDPDNVDGYQTNTGFPISRQNSVDYMRFLAREAHKLGLSIGLKNAGGLARDVLDHFDFAVTEDCFDQGWCASSRNFTNRGKAVFAIEYTDNGINFNAFCAQAALYQLSPIYKRRNLDTWERRCP
jgi:hypothetical protein